jgi:hypothetical protein
MQMQMQQLQHKVKKTKKPVKKQTVVQVLQSPAPQISGGGARDPLMDAYLGK